MSTNKADLRLTCGLVAELLQLSTPMITRHNLIERQLRTFIFLLFSGGLCLLLVSIALGGNPEIERTRVLFFWRWAELLTLLTTFSMVIGQKKNSLYRPLVISIFVLLGWLIFSSLIGVDVSKSYWGNYYRRDGLLTIVHLLLLAWVCAASWQQRFKQFLVSGLVLGELFLSFSVLIWYFFSGVGQQFLPSFITLWLPRFTLANENMVAGCLAIALPFTWYVFKAGSGYFPGKKFAAVTGGTTLLAIFLTHSWGAIISIGVVSCLVILNWFGLKHLIFKVGVGVTGVLLVAAVLRSIPSGTAEDRLQFFPVLLQSVWQRPIAGWGWANVDLAYESVLSDQERDAQLYLDKAHSHWLEYLVTSGIVGLALYIYLQYVLISQIFRQDQDKSWRTCLLLTVNIFILHSQTNVVSIVEESLFWVVVGISLAKRV